MLKKMTSIKRILEEGFKTETYCQHGIQKHDEKTYRITGTLENFEEFENSLEEIGIQFSYGNKGRNTDTLSVYIQDHIEDMKHPQDRRDLHNQVANSFYLYDENNNMYGVATGYIGLNSEIEIQLFY